MEKNLFTNYRVELEGKIARLRTEIEHCEAELVRVNDALSLFDSLSGAKGSAPRPADRSEPSIVPPKVPANEPPLTDKIQTVLREAYRQGLRGLEPSGIYDAIIAKGWSTSKDNVRTTTWRIWKDARLWKADDSPLYGILELPGMTPGDNEKPADDVSEQDASAGLFSNVPAVTPSKVGGP